MGERECDDTEKRTDALRLSVESLFRYCTQKKRKMIHADKTPPKAEQDK